MRRHWSGVIRLIAIIAGSGAGIWEKFVLGGGWIPAMTLMILVFLAIPVITGVVWEAAGRLMEWREINLRSGTLDGLAPTDMGHRPMTPPRRFPPPWRVVEMPGGYAVEDADGIARLGGYLARANDPPPGNMVIWRGLSRLANIEFGAGSIKNCG
jgi:hypothetical protein